MNDKDIINSLGKISISNLSQENRSSLIVGIGKIDNWMSYVMLTLITNRYQINLG